MPGSQANMIKTSAHKLSMPAAAAQHALTGSGTIQARKILFGWLPRSQNALLEESARECSLDWSLLELVHVDEHTELVRITLLFLPVRSPSISPSSVLEWACRPEQLHADFETEHPYMIVEVDGARLSRAGPAESLTGQSLTRGLVPPDSRVVPAAHPSASMFLDADSASQLSEPASIEK